MAKSPNITTAPTGNIAPFGLRMLPELREKVEDAAKATGRSMNAEIVSRLERTFGESTAGDDGLAFKSLALRLAESDRRAALFALMAHARLLDIVIVGEAMKDAIDVLAELGLETYKDEKDVLTSLRLFDEAVENLEQRDISHEFDVLARAVDESTSELERAKKSYEAALEATGASGNNDPLAPYKEIVRRRELLADNASKRANKQATIRAAATSPQTEPAKSRLELGSARRAVKKKKNSE